MIKFFLRLILLPVLLIGCQLGPTYRAPVTTAPDHWKHETDCKEVPKVCFWWEIFEDETLNELETLALENNNELYAALSRVAEARSIACIKKADLFPQLNLNPNYSNQEILTKIFVSEAPCLQKLFPKICAPGSNLLREHQITNALPLTLNYELDLWGYIRNQYASAAYHAEAEMEAFQTTLLILTTDLADAYFQLRGLDAQIDNYLTTIETRKIALSINQSRYEEKIVNYSDVSRAALELTNVEAAYYDVRLQRELMENRIAVLVGMPPSDLCLEHNALTEQPPCVPSGVPSTILLQRPDIAEAERDRAAEHALINVAYASFFPSISLTGILGFSSPDIKHFLSWSSRYYLMGGSASQTIFDAGRKVCSLDLAWAQFYEADREYQQTVLVAFQEVEDALAGLEWLYRQAEMITLSVDSATTTYNIASDRFDNGVTFYLDVVDSERDQLNAQRNLIDLLSQRYSATVQLIKALGGNW